MCCGRVTQLRAMCLKPDEEMEEIAACITQHPGFQEVCLARWAFQAAYHQEWGDGLEEEPPSE